MIGVPRPSARRPAEDGMRARELVQFVSELHERTLATQTYGRRFLVEVDRDDLLFTPDSTGILRREPATKDPKDAGRVRSNGLVPQGRLPGPVPQRIVPPASARPLPA